MSVLRNLEAKLAGLVEGTFSRAFKSEVRPEEIARKLAREMDQRRIKSLSRVYVPNEYAVWLSPADREQFAAYEDELREELAGYLLEHARRENFALITEPAIEFKTDEQLRLGQFGIQARLVRPDERPDVPARQAEAGHTMVYSTFESEPARAKARLRIAGRTELLGSNGATVGRSREVDIMLDDENVSRRHAELRPTGGGWVVRDLGSTNGVRVNGHSVEAGRPCSIRPGDEIEFGTTQATFDLS